MTDKSQDDVAASVRIPFDKPCLSGRELQYIEQLLTAGSLSSDGEFTRRCVGHLEQRYGIFKALLTPSCTAALEMAAILCDLQPGDEVIMPSFTFVSTANSAVLRGGRPVFVDVRRDTHNLDETLIEQRITSRTKAIFLVHYAGVACEMDPILEIARRRGLLVVEDAAQAIHAFYRGQPLGAIGDLGAYSFHYTKNLVCGEGGSLCVNRPELVARAEIIREKGTNRRAFLNGQVDKYSWVDIGSSQVNNELASAVLFAQLEQTEKIHRLRRAAYQRYYELLQPLQVQERCTLPTIPEHCCSNHHMFHILLESKAVRDGLLAQLRSQGIMASFHYIPLHMSEMGGKFGYQQGDLPVTEHTSDCLLRLPLYPEITEEQQNRVVSAIEDFLKSSAGGGQRR